MKHINININYNVSSFDELLQVVQKLTGNKHVDVNIVTNNNNEHTQLGGLHVEADRAVREVMLANGYRDLGLPSGTLWKNKLDVYFIDHETAMASYKLPTKEQFEELFKHTKVMALQNSIKFIAANGNFITLPKRGYTLKSSLVNGDAGLYLHIKTDDKNNMCAIINPVGEGGYYYFPKLADITFTHAEKAYEYSILTCSKPFNC